MNEELEGHFAFGDNWRDYARAVTQREVEEAWRGVNALLVDADLSGHRVLDLGCGSGVHSVAMAQHGALVTAVDLDPESVATTRDLALRFGVSDRIETMTASVFALPPECGTFDIVYSWGVLHHTGEMWKAVDEAASHVGANPGSRLILALYRKTKLDAFWKSEKRIYKSSPSWLQWVIRRLFALAHDFARILNGRNPRREDAEYFRQRGMSREHDYHDWLGGYPYESEMPADVRKFVETRGFQIAHEMLVLPDDVTGHGIFGSGCDQFVFVRKQLET